MKKIQLILVVISFSCSSKSDKSSEFGTSDIDRFKTSIDSLFNAEIGMNEPGAALLVSYDGEILIGKGYGLRDVETNQPITASTNLRMASVSKQFTALNILSLVESGALSLSDEVYTYLPYPIFKNRTIEHLINHTSGLPDYEKHFEKDWDKSNILENKNVLQWLATDPEPVFEPGEKWEYSNTAYLMLALIVEKVGGQEFSKYAKSNIFEKAGMKNTNYFNLAQPIEIPERAYCYEKDSLGKFNKVDGFFMNGVMGDGAVYTSINDYFQYDLALRNNAILSEEIHEKIFEPSSKIRVDPDVHYAMGWSVTDTAASHTGGWYGTNTFTKRYLNKPLTIAIFMNRNTLFENGLVGKTDSMVVAYVEAKAKLNEY